MIKRNYKKLGEICDFVGGSQPPKSNFVYDLNGLDSDQYVRLIQIRDYKSNNHIVYIPRSMAKKFCSKDDVMIGRYGPPLFQILRGLEGAYNVALMKAVPKKTDQLDQDYLFLFLQSPDIQGYVINLSERAAGQTGVNKPALYNYPILLPPIQEQKRIVAILDQAFADIEKIRANTETNLKHARELFESYLQKVFQGGEGWEIKKLGDFLKLEYGKSLDRSLRKNNGKYPAYGANGIKAWSDEFYYDTRTIIVGRKGSAGEITLTEEKFWPLDVTYFVKFDEKKYNLYFIYYLLSSLNLPSLATGVKPGINRNNIYSIEVNVPNVQEQKRIVAILRQVFNQADNISKCYKAKLLELDSLKKSLLHQAFTGKLTQQEVTA